VSVQVVGNPNDDHSPAYDAAILDRRHHSGSGWFYWIAGLSIVTSIIGFMGGSLSFMAGLGVTQIADAIALGASQNGSALSSLLKATAVGFDVVVALIFVFFGYMSRKHLVWAYWMGLCFYVLDALILLAFQSWLSAAFHAYAIYCIWNGLQACRTLKKPASIEPA
jgi:hypothetical protein